MVPIYPEISFATGAITSHEGVKASLIECGSCVIGAEAA